MSFNVLVHIAEDSQRGRVIQMIAAEQHVTPEQVIEQIIDAGMDEAVQAAQKKREDLTMRRGPRAPLRIDDGQTVIGMFAGNPGFRESVDSAISNRAGRYGTQP